MPDSLAAATKAGLLAWQLLPEDMPEPVPALGTQEALRVE